MAEEKTFTQDEVNAIVGERLRRSEEQMQKKYADYLSPDDFKNKSEGFNSQIADLNKSLEDANTKLKEFEAIGEDYKSKIAAYELDSVKTRIANELGLPYELKDRLTGANEEDLRKDAENLLGIVQKNSTGFIPPAKDPNLSQDEDGVMAKFRELNPNIKF